MKTSLRQGFTLIELLVVIAIIAILASILFPVFVTAREKGRQSKCLSNQRQLAMAITMDATENEETYPQAQTVWNDIGVPSQLLICPTKGKIAPNGYLYSNAVAGISMGEIEKPSIEILTADGLHAAQTIAQLTVADSTPQPEGVIFATGGPVTVETIQASMSVSYTSQISLHSPGNVAIGTNKTVGATRDLGTIANGTELIFKILVQDTDDTFYTGPAERNPDGAVHAYVERIDADTVHVRFEDSRLASDRDFLDVEFNVHGNLIIASAPPTFDQIMYNANDVNLRHNGCAIASFCDGHVELLKELTPLWIIDLSTQNEFTTSVLQSRYPVMVVFEADWCGWCQRLTPIVDEVASAYRGRVKVVRVDGDKLPSLNGTYNITGYPTVLFFKNGAETGRINGFSSDVKSKIEQQLQPIL